MLNSLDDLDWPENVKTMQKNWIGKSKGAEIKYKIENSDDYLTAFSTRPDTIFGVSFLAIAPNHPIAIELSNRNKEIDDFLINAKKLKLLKQILQKLKSLE